MSPGRVDTCHLMDENGAMTTPRGLLRLLNLYCCEGGSASGYDAGGLVVVGGVDVVPQPLYPYPFVLSDAVQFLREHADWIRENVDLVDASPPCQLYSATYRLWNREHPDLIGPTREALEEVGLPYVIENVEEARSELKSPVTLCGAMFGMRTYRHRLFETGGWTLRQPGHPKHAAPVAKMGRAAKPGEFVSYVGHYSGVGASREDMRMPWATRAGIAEAVPPQYTEWIAEQFREWKGDNS